MKVVSSFTFAVSPQLTIGAVLLTRSNGITLFGGMGRLMFGPAVHSVPALAPDAVGAASTTFAA